MRLRSLACSLALGLLAAAPLAAQDVGLPIGTRAPSAVVETLDGRQVDLASYYGRTPVVLEFWASWCDSCKELEPKFRAVASRYAGRVKLVAVAVSVNQSPARVRAFAKQHPMPMDIVYDRAGNATGEYDAPATSYVVVVDRAGRVVYTGQGGGQDLDAAIRRALP